MKIQRYKIFAGNTLIVTLHSYINRVSEPLAPLITLTIFALFISVIARVGFRSSALLAMLLSNESASDSELCPVSPESSQETSTATDASSLPGSTAAICSPSSPKSKVRERKTGSSKSQHCITILNKKWCLWKELLLLLLWSLFQKFKCSRVGHSFAKIQSTYALICWVFLFIYFFVLFTNRINLRIKRKEQRCCPLQAWQMRRKESWLLRTLWIPAASARHLLCPVRTPSLL